MIFLSFSNATKIASLNVVCICLSFSFASLYDVVSVQVYLYQPFSLKYFTGLYFCARRIS